MTAPSDQPLTALLPVPRRRSALATLLRDPIALVSLLVLAIATLVAVTAPLIAPFDANDSDLAISMSGPSLEHPLGADRAGRDLLSRLILATPTSLGGAALAVAIALAIGIPTGLAAGMRGGWFTSVSNWVTDLVMALPAIIVLLAVRAMLGPSIWLAMAIFGLILSPSVFRLVQSAVLGVRNELFVDAARVSGLTTTRILGRHVLRVVRAPIIIQAAFLSGIAIGFQAGLEFIGIGDYTIPTWGGMLFTAFKEVYVAPLQMLWPGIAIALLSAALVLLGNSLTDVFGGSKTAMPPRARSSAIAPPTMTAAPATLRGLLDVHGLRIGYPEHDGTVREVVRGITLQVKEGEVLGLVGESGSGKTQTALGVLGLLPPGGRVHAGEIGIDGASIGAATPRRRRELLGQTIGYVPQEPLVNLDPAFRVGGQIARSLRLREGLSRSAAKARVITLLARVGIVDPERTYGAYPHEISGGMAQRVLIAGAVALRPRLLIADEPTTALDVTVQAEVLDLLRELKAEFGMGILLVTHNFGVVSDICDRVAVMQDGTIVEEGPVKAILRDPQHPYTQRLLGAMLEGKTPVVAAKEDIR